MADDCLFCRIARQEIPVPLVHDADGYIAFRDINPQAPTHILVVPREHIASLNDATDAAMIGRLSLVAAQIAKQEGIAESGYRTVINTNRDGGQTVFHIHLHLLGGRRLAWPPG
jgi:histidine triad (HIT) family protein